MIVYFQQNDRIFLAKLSYSFQIEGSYTFSQKIVNFSAKWSYSFSSRIVYFQSWSYTFPRNDRILSVMIVYFSAKRSYTFSSRTVYFQSWSYTLRVTRKDIPLLTTDEALNFSIGARSLEPDRPCVHEVDGPSTNIRPSIHLIFYRCPSSKSVHEVDVISWKLPSGVRVDGWTSADSRPRPSRPASIYLESICPCVHAMDAPSKHPSERPSQNLNWASVLVQYLYGPSPDGRWGLHQNVLSTNQVW